MISCFSVTSNKITSFRELVGDVDRINIRGVQSQIDNIHSLFSPINIETKYANNGMRSYYVHTHPYYSNRKPGIATDREMSVIIPECRYSTIEIQRDESTVGGSFKLDFFYEVIPSVVDEVIVYRNKQIEDVTFSLHPTSRVALQKAFPNAIQARSVSAGYTTMWDFEQIYGNIFYSMFKALTGLNFIEVCGIKRVSLADPVTNERIADSVSNPLLLDLAANRYQ